MSMLSINPMASYQFTDRLAIGGGPVITTGGANFGPAFFAPTPGPFGIADLPRRRPTRTPSGARASSSVCSTRSMTTGTLVFRTRARSGSSDGSATRPPGLRRQTRSACKLLCPRSSRGASPTREYEKALIDVDLRYIDYANSELFGQSVASGGLGWRGVFAVATGMQYSLTERLTLRGGYLFNTNPIPAPVTLFNVQAPAITQHTLSVGASYRPDREHHGVVRLGSRRSTIRSRARSSRYQGRR